jgi:hypothetical protein
MVLCMVSSSEGTISSSLEESEALHSVQRRRPIYRIEVDPNHKKCKASVILLFFLDESMLLLFYFLFP